MDYPEITLPGDPSHNQPPNPDTIACARKILLKGPCYSCLCLSAWQIQKWMLTVIYKMEHRAPNGGARERTQRDEGVCNSIGGTTLWTNQYPGARVSSCIYIKRWPSRPSLGREEPWYCKLYMPQYRAKKWEWVGRGAGWEESIGDFWDSIWNVKEENT